MDTFSPSPDCQHSKNGLCSKCILNQSFSISPAEERHRRNLSNGSIRSMESPGVSQSAASISTTNAEFTSFPTLPVPLKAVQPQTADELESKDENHYTSFSDLKKFSSIKIQEENNKNDGNFVTTPLVEPSSWSMRLFQSSLFSPSIAMQYLFSSTEKGVRSYLGNRLSSFEDEDVDFFIPELVNMYIHNKEIASAIHPYIVERCQQSIQFALLCVWLLESFGVDRLKMKDKTMAHGEMLRQMILNDFRSPQYQSKLSRQVMVGDKCTTLNASLLDASSLSGNVHLNRSESAASSLKYLNLSPSHLGASRTLDTGCRCFEEKQLKKCECGADRLSGEKYFVTWLTKIGSRLTEEATKSEKTRRLVSELLLLNMQLPARVWIPLFEDHIVLRIPPSNSCVLNSKDKAPYCIYVEVLRCEDVMTVPVPKSLSEAECELHLRLRSNSFASLNDVPMSALDVVDDGGINIESRNSPIDANAPCTPTLYETSPDKILQSEQSWDTMSMQSSASEPVLRNGRIQPAEIGRRLKQWVKRPGRRRQMRAHPDDPSASTMSEPWEEKRERIRHASPYGRLPGWDLLPVIVKSGDDLAQELIAYQLLVTLKNIWDEEHVALYLRPYKILVTSSDSGMIEPIVDACSLHQIKRNLCSVYQEEGRTTIPTLEAYFIDTYGPKGTGSFLRAQQNFVQSCAAYSLICYFLQVKDRHNGNILIDADGHLIHIDFGFILSVSPKNLGFETAPFKLTSEIVDVMGGLDSDLYFYFKTLLIKGLIAARKHQERILTIIEIMSKGSILPCFRAGPSVLTSMKDRFHMTYTDKQLEHLINTMVDQSRDSLTTRLYDNFQYYTNGIL